MLLRYIVTLKDFLKLIRFPNLLILIWCQYFSRIFLIGPKSQWKVHIVDTKLFFIVLASMLIASSGYIINDYYDIEIDRINKPKRIILDIKINSIKSLKIAVLLNIIGTIMGFMVSLEIGILCLFYIFMLWLYASFLKKTPFFGNLSVALMSAGSVLILSLYYSGNMIFIYLFTGFSFFISLIREIIKDIEDIEGDSAFKCNTLPIFLGIKKTKAVIYLVIILFFIFVIFFVQNYTMIIYFLLLAFFMIYFINFLSNASKKEDFSRLSFYTKAIILSGIVMMSLI